MRDVFSEDETQMISMEISSTPAKCIEEFDQYVQKRNRAFQTFDYEKIVRVMKRYGVPAPEDNCDFWLYVAQTVLELPTATSGAKKEAIRILDELNEER